jgi:hypothetical protein
MALKQPTDDQSQAASRDNRDQRHSKASGSLILMFDLDIACAILCKLEFMWPPSMRSLPVVDVRMTPWLWSALPPRVVRKASLLPLAVPSGSGRIWVLRPLHVNVGLYPLH